MSIAALYEAWPYPDPPRFAGVSRASVWQLHVDWLRSFAGLPPGPARPRVWIAGCGTVQPSVFGVANPNATLLCTDASAASLAVAARQCRWRGVRHAELAQVDLEQPDALPDGPFDLIECYGVLMNLADPGAALARMAARLAPDGALRLMVYPWYGRRRVLQIARVAQLVGLRWQHRDHPRRLRRLMADLPRSHPLRFTFEDYADSTSDAGVVDGFLHTSEVAYTAAEILALVDGAGLEVAGCMHRPWGQPTTGGPAGLGLAPGPMLHYLDAWQELKSNFVLVCRRKEAPLRRAGTGVLHPSFVGGAAWGSPPARGWARFAGATLPDRLGEGPLRLSGAAVRALPTDPGPLAVYAGDGQPASVLPFAAPDDAEARAPRIYLGEGVPSPAWQHHLVALGWLEALGGPAIDAQIAAWRPVIRPLEDKVTPYGFSPFVTWQNHTADLQAWRARTERPVAEGWRRVRLANEPTRLGQMMRWLSPHVVDGPLSLAAMRELWTLLDGYRHPFLDLEPF